MKKTPRSSRRPVRIAVVGLGFMGVTHLRTYLGLKGVQVVAVCDGSGRVVNGVLRGVNGNIQQPEDVKLPSEVKVYHQLADVLADAEVDAVDLCTPTALHADHLVAALRAGKHVLCEKPLVEHLRQAPRVLAAAARARKVVMPAMCMRFWPGWSWLRETLPSGRYGRVLAADFRRVSVRPKWGRNGSHSGGALLDLHIHDTDFVNHLFGRPAAVFSTGVSQENGGVDHVVTKYLYPDGPVVQAEGSWLLQHGFNMSFAIHCEQATISYDYSRGAAALQISERGRPPRTVRLSATDGYAEEIRYFVDCLAHGRAPERVGLGDAVAALEICAAEAKSIRTGKIVKLRPALPVHCL